MPLPGWSYDADKQIDPQYIDAAISGLVMPVFLDAEDAAFWAAVRSDGGDIRVTSVDQLTEYPTDLAVWDHAGQSGVLYFKTGPVDNVVGATFRIHAGNAGATRPLDTDLNGRNAVYSSQYIYKCHLEETPSGSNTTLLDSAGVADWDLDAGTNRGSFPATVGRGIYVNVPSNVSGFIKGESPQTEMINHSVGFWEFWFQLDVNAPSTESTRLVGTATPANTNRNHWLRLRYSSSYPGGAGWRLQEFVRIQNNSFVARNYYGSTPIQKGVSYHVVLIQTGGEAKIYVNGVEESYTIEEGSRFTTEWWHNYHSSQTRHWWGENAVNPNPNLIFRGLWDELGVGKVALSAAHIKARYSCEKFNQEVASPFYTPIAPACEITIESASPSSCSGGTYDLTVSVSYSNEPGTGTIDLTVDGVTTNHAITGSPQVIVRSGLPCSGTIESVDVEFSDDPACNDSDTYQAPAGCELTIDTIVPNTCQGSTGCDYVLDVTVSYSSEPGSGTLDFTINGTPYSRAITSSPQTESFTLPCDSGTGTVDVEFSAEPTCNDSDTYTKSPAEPCVISIEGIRPGACIGATYEVEFDLTYSSEPCSGTLQIRLNSTDVYNFPINGSPQTVVVTGRPCGEGVVTAEAFFSLAGCIDSSSYSAPAPACFLIIDGISPGVCDVNEEYSVSIDVSYGNQPGSGSLEFIIGGTPYLRPITGSPQTEVFTGLPCDAGTVPVNISFTDDPACNAVGNYTAPSAAEPYETYRFLYEGAEVRTLSFSELQFSLIREDFEYYYDFPIDLGAFGSFFNTLYALYASNTCNKPILTIESKCFGSTTWDKVADVEIDLSRSVWDLCTCTVVLDVKEVSAVSRLRERRSEPVTVELDREISGLYETETNFEFEGETVDGIRLFDLTQQVVDQIVGAGVLTVQSNFLTSDYLPELWDCHLEFTSGNFPVIQAYLTGEGYGHERRGAGLFRNDGYELQRTIDAFHFTNNFFPDKTELLFPYADYQRLNAPPYVDPLINENDFTIVSHHPLSLLVAGATGTTFSKSRSIQYGAGNCVIVPNLEEGEEIEFTWSGLTDLFKKVFGLGIYYRDNVIEIEPFHEFFTASGVPNTPVDFPNDNPGTVEGWDEWRQKEIYFGIDYPLTWQQEREDELDWIPAGGNYQTGLTLEEEKTIEASGEYQFAGDIVLDSTTNGSSVTIDVVLYVDGYPREVIAAGEVVPPGNPSYNVSYTTFNKDINVGQKVAIVFENPSDPTLALALDPGATWGFNYSVALQDQCPAGPVIRESSYPYFKNPFLNDGLSCEGEALDWRTDEFFGGMGRLVGNSRNQGDTLKGNYLFYCDLAENKLIRYRNEFFYNSNSGGDATGVPCPNYEDFVSPSNRNRVSHYFYNAPLSRMHIMFYNARSHRLNLSFQFKRLRTSTANVSGDRMNQVKDDINFFTFGYEGYSALGRAPFKLWKTEIPMSWDDFKELRDSLRVQVTICGQVVQGDVKSCIYNALKSTAELEILSN